MRPRPGVIEDALKLLEYWPSELELPEPEMGPDGTVALEIYEESGFNRGGFDFKGECKATFVVIFRLKVIASGIFYTNSNEEILKAISTFKNALLTGDPDVK